MELKELSSRLEGKSVVESLKELAYEFPGKVIFTTSFGIEDQVITYFILRNEIPIEVITLDTGRLFPETYQVFAETFLKYKKKINVYFPEYEAVERLVTEKGPFSFYESKENRLECCHIRKVVPLNRALKDKSIWITGIRAEQSDNRSGMTNLEYDDIKKIIKYHPLFSWTLREVEDFIKQYDIPYNSLHDKGYLSIGCEPCTKPVIKGQDFRSGRWWWEADSTKECGCHVKYSETKD
jgi:phosphoadenosine phosphosulfate reductase